jgi:hypothetical protein
MMIREGEEKEMKGFVSPTKMIMMVVVIGEDLITNKKRIEPMPRIELGTSSLPRKRSTTELHRLVIFLSGRPGSNRRHSAWKADALPTELLPHYCVGRAGFEPAKVKTNRFTVCPRWPLEYLPKLNILKN